MTKIESIPAGDRDITSLRAYPRSWYLLDRSSKVRAGQVRSYEFLGHAIVLFRTQTGELHALAAHCAHMGAHLDKGTVVDDCLRCPLHHWTFEGSGSCRSTPHAPGQRSWPIEERYGNIFIFNGARPLFPLPAFRHSANDQLRMRTGKPVDIRCAWVAVAANAFDMQHLSVVHDRALIEPPAVDLLDPFTLRLRYRSHVTGRGLANQFTQWLSGNRIEVEITCSGGTLFTVESRVGRVRTALLLGLMPKDNAVRAAPIFGVRRSKIPGLDRLKGLITTWLFSQFMYKDVAILEDMRFRVMLCDLPASQPLRQFLDFIDRLPAEPA